MAEIFRFILSGRLLNELPSARRETESKIGIADPLLPIGGTANENDGLGSIYQPCADEAVSYRKPAVDAIACSSTLGKTKTGKCSLSHRHAQSAFVRTAVRNTDESIGIVLQFHTLSYKANGCPLSGPTMQAAANNASSTIGSLPLNSAGAP